MNNRIDKESTWTMWWWIYHVHRYNNNGKDSEQPMFKRTISTKQKNTHKDVKMHQHQKYLYTKKQANTQNSNEQQKTTDTHAKTNQKHQNNSHKEHPQQVKVILSHWTIDEPTKCELCGASFWAISSDCFDVSFFPMFPLHVLIFVFFPVFWFWLFWFCIVLCFSLFGLFLFLCFGLFSFAFVVLLFVLVCLYSVHKQWCTKMVPRSFLLWFVFIIVCSLRCSWFDLPDFS